MLLHIENSSSNYENLSQNLDMKEKGFSMKLEDIEIIK